MNIKQIKEQCLQIIQPNQNAETIYNSLTIILDNNYYDEYIMQYVSAACFNANKYDLAEKIIDQTLMHFYNSTNLRNKILVLKKLNKDIKPLLLDIIYNHQPTIYDLEEYISLENNVLDSYRLLIQLNQNTKIKTDEFYHLINILIQSNSVYNTDLLIILKNVFQNYLNLTEITNDIIINNLFSLQNKYLYNIAIYYLTHPKILFDDVDNVKLHYDQVLQNLDKLIFYFNTNPIYENPNELLQALRVNIYYYFSYYGFNNVEIYQKISKLYCAICPSLIYNIPKLNKTTDKIKIGFISDLIFYNHSVCRDRLGIIKALILDPRFEVYLLTTHNEEQFIFSEVMKNIQFNKIIIERDILKTRETIKNLELNIIVYPEIGMDFFYYLLAYSRLAPIQINTWGHSETSGLDAIDYYFSSKYYEKDTSQNYYSESLIQLDSLCTFYTKINIDPYPKEMGYGKFGLSSQYNNYGVLQAVFKYHPTFIESIKQILIKDPKAFIVFLSYEKLEDRFEKYLTKHLGDFTDRIQISSRLKFVDYMMLLSSLDLIIDSFPFGGCNTTLEAFVLNKVVVTLPVDKLSGRFTFGFYQRMGITEPVCSTINEFVDKVVYFGNDSDARFQVEKMIQENKEKLFGEIESIETWKNKLIELSY